MSQMIKLPKQEMSVEALKALIAEAEARKPPTFAVGEWVVMGGGKPFQVAKLETSGHYGFGAVQSSNGFVYRVEELRRLTPAEILAAQWAEVLEPLEEGKLYRMGRFDDVDAAARKLLFRVVGGILEMDGDVGWRKVRLAPDCFAGSSRLVPYTPPPPTFQVGQWVRPISDSVFANSLWQSTARKVIEPKSKAPDETWCYFKGEGSLFTWPAELRLATPEEIAAATRIVPKVGMLLRNKNNGRVFLIQQLLSDGGIGCTSLLRDSDCWSATLNGGGHGSLTTERYEILDSYTVQGIR